MSELIRVAYDDATVAVFPRYALGEFRIERFDLAAPPLA